jgi:hypothetical protein
MPPATATANLERLLARVRAMPIAGVALVATPTGRRPWLALADGRPLTDASGRARHFATRAAARAAADRFARGSRRATRHHHRQLH